MKKLVGVLITIFAINHITEIIHEISAALNAPGSDAYVAGRVTGIVFEELVFVCLIYLFIKYFGDDTKRIASKIKSFLKNTIIIAKFKE